MQMLRPARVNMLKLPNPDKAVIDIDKLSGYCLNLTHNDGQHKARVFRSALNLGMDEADVLRTALLQAIRNQLAIPAKGNEYGQKFIVDFEMRRSDKKALVRSAWIVRNNEDFPILITCYVL